MNIKGLFISLLISCLFNVVFASGTELYFPDLKSQKGNILIAVLDQTGKEIELRIVQVENLEVRVKLNKLEVGKKYAVKAFHDVNGNKKLDTNFFGVPTEPYGFSNNARGTFGPPSLSEMIFIADSSMIMEIKLH